MARVVVGGFPFPRRHLLKMREIPRVQIKDDLMLTLAAVTFPLLIIGGLKFRI